MQLAEHLQQRLDALPRKTLRVAERQFDYIDAGQGPVVMLLHGIGSGAASWVCQFEALAEDYRMIAWNAPGYGATTALNQSKPDAGDYAGALKTLCDALEIDAMHLVGQSLGAIIAARFSRLYPQQINSLTLLNPARGHGQSDAETRAKMCDTRLQNMAELGVEGNAEKRAPTQLSDNPGADALALVRWNLAQLNPDGYAQAVEFLANAHLPDDASYQGPVQVISGGADRIVPTVNAQEIAHFYPQHQFHIVPDVGHAAYVEGPKLINQLLREFFRLIQND